MQINSNGTGSQGVRRMAFTLTSTGLLALAVAMSGCGKKQPVAAEQSSVNTQATASTPSAPGVPAPGPLVLNPPAETMVQSSGQPDLHALNRCMVRWLIANKRRPKDFEEFSATAGMPIPPPPAGKKYAIGDNMHIVLVNQ